TSTRWPSGSGASTPTATSPSRTSPSAASRTGGSNWSGSWTSRRRRDPPGAGGGGTGGSAARVHWSEAAMTEFVQFVLIGLVAGSVYALIAIGYTMVYGIIELINFAHGDLFMLGSFLALQVAVWVGVAAAPASASTGAAVLAVAAMLVAAPVFCAALNVTIDRLVYKPVRAAPKL